MGNVFYSISLGGIYSTNYSYPFGSLLPGRSLNPTNYRYSYQNQEKDNETGYHNFQLRQYASLLGRWMTPDPYGQHWSPYLAMSNNPVSYIDPDGGQDCQNCGDPSSTSYFDRWQNESLEDFPAGR
jgi:RHS repeat-associated protein